MRPAAPSAAAAQRLPIAPNDPDARNDHRAPDALAALDAPMTMTAARARIDPPAWAEPTAAMLAVRLCSESVGFFRARASGSARDASLASLAPWSPV